jgi:signal transduction histidine kinase
LFESNRLKSEFLANVSHELRTPLTSIIGFADLLRDSAQGEGVLDKKRIARFAHNILTSGRLLLDIINDLLDLAKIEAGKIELHRSSFSLRDVCEALSDFMKPLVDKNSLTFEIDLQDNLPVMYSDAGKIRQVLFNLLSNAVKYTPPGGVVRLEARSIDNDQAVQLIVADNGPGIAPEDQQRIFEKFQQLDPSVTREHSGTGLGLPISKEICNLLGGTIRLESELNKGSRFIVELPVECPEMSNRPAISLL